MTEPLSIPVSSAKNIAKKYGYDQVLIYARKVGEEGTEHITTYGVNEEHCDATARIGTTLKGIAGWPPEEADYELARAMHDDLESGTFGYEDYDTRQEQVAALGRLLYPRGR